MATSPAPDETALKDRRENEARALAKSGAAQSADARRRSAPVQPGASADIAARLSVVDRAAAPPAVANLVSRAGGTVVSSNAEGDERVLELIVPRAELPRLLEGLRALGTLASDIPPDLPPNVRVVLRIGA